MKKGVAVKIILAFVGSLLWNSLAVAQNCPSSFPYTLSNGTTADANQVMANFNAIQACPNLIGVKVFTTSGTYTCDSGTSKVVIEVQGGGGAGGGAGASSSTTGSLGSGGSAGGYYKGLATAGFCGATVTVGSAATGVSGGNGNNGTAVSFVLSGGVNISAGGGAGGSFVGVVAASVSGSGTGGTVSASGAQTILSINGVPGGWTAWNTNFGMPGAGANAPLGSGGQQIALSLALGLQQTGAPGVGYGCGGAGALSYLMSSGGAAQAGGNGCPGIVVVWEY